jgi:hypothetical protein
MKTTPIPPLCVLLSLAALLGLLPGCEEPGSNREEPRPAAARAPASPPEAKKTLLAPNVWLEVQGKRRRVVLSGEICLREGALELLMCRKNTKEHEAIVTADLDGRDIHKALNVAGATEGSPVRYRPKFQPAKGTAIRVWIQYEDKDKGKLVTVNARDWVKNMKTGKVLETDWVFAGSYLVDNPLDPKKPKYYLANDGDLICVSNFETAMLDVPIASSKDDADREYIAFTERIPPVGTKVAVILEPLLEEKKDR